MTQGIHWQESFDDFRKRYSEMFPWSVMVGSLVYGAEFKKTSDIDLLIGLDSIKDWQSICENLTDSTPDFIKTTIRLYHENKGEYFCLKFQHQGIDYSADFFDLSFVKRMVKDINAPEDVIYYKLTNKPQTNSYLMTCGETRLHIPKRNIEYEHGVVGVSSPLFKIEPEKFFFGIMLDKLLTGYSSVWQQQDFDRNIEELCVQGLQRMLSDSNTETLRNAFANLARYERLPIAHINDQIKHYESLL
ncbi:MAG: hypothetical protein ACMXYG_03150 [Candidatus Woesearchaeota archaeon]